MTLSRNLKQWLILLVPYLVMGAFSLGGALLLLPLGGTVGLWVGFTSSNEFFTPQFKAGLALACAISLALVCVGWPQRQHFWGKAFCAAGLYLWCMAGVVGFGPQ